MKKTCLVIFALLIAAALPSAAQEPATFAEAKQQSLEQGKPLLIEFFREE